MLTKKDATDRRLVVLRFGVAAGPAFQAVMCLGLLAEQERLLAKIETRLRVRLDANADEPTVIGHEQAEPYRMAADTRTLVIVIDPRALVPGLVVAEAYLPKPRGVGRAAPEFLPRRELPRRLRGAAQADIAVPRQILHGIADAELPQVRRLVGEGRRGEQHRGKDQALQYQSPGPVAVWRL